MVVNFASNQGQCYVRLPFTHLEEKVEIKASLEELEKLRRPHNGVGNGGLFDQFFLRDLGAEPHS